jgi:hypothetical protein
MINLLAATLLVLQATAAHPGPPYLVVVVDDPKEVRRAIDIRVDGTFTPTQEEAEAPRRDLARYLESESHREKSKERQESLRRISRAQHQYLWHCAGYKKAGQKNLFCSFVRREPSELFLRKAFPAIKDGGTSVCRCHFSLKSGRIARLEWNGEA